MGVAKLGYSDIESDIVIVKVLVRAAFISRLYWRKVYF